jgi:hypothetical protein
MDRQKISPPRSPRTEARPINMEPSSVWRSQVEPTWCLAVRRRRVAAERKTPPLRAKYTERPTRHKRRQRKRKKGAFWSPAVGATADTTSGCGGSELEVKENFSLIVTLVRRGHVVHLPLSSLAVFFAEPKPGRMSDGVIRPPTLGDNPVGRALRGLGVEVHALQGAALPGRKGKCGPDNATLALLLDIV